MKLIESLRAITTVGRYQWMLIGLYMLSNISGWSWTGILIMAPNVKFRCVADGSNDGNFTDDHENCFVNQSQLSEMDIMRNTSQRELCTKFEYDHSQFQYTLTERFNLVCDRSWMISIVKSSYLAGYLVGSISCGVIGDKFGRKMTVIIFCIVAALMQIGSSFVPNIWAYIVMRFLIGISDISNYILFFLLVQESVRKDQRAVPKLIDSAFLDLAGGGLAAVTLLVSNHLYLHLVMGVAAGLNAVFTLLMAHESPRWLAAQKKDKKAMKVIEKISKSNHREEGQFSHLLNTTEEAHGGKWLDLFLTPLIRKRTVLLIFIWVVFILAYFSIAYNLGDFSKDVRISLVFSGAIEIIMTLPIYMLIRKFGRTRVMFCLLLLSSFCCFAMAPLVTYEHSIALNVLAISGILFLNNVFFTIYIYTPEIFPTTIRGMGLGVCSASARVVAILAPQVALLNRFWPPFMVVTLGILVLVAAFITPMLPDTSNVELPQSVEDGENLFSDHKYSLRKPKYRGKDNDEQEENMGSANV